jgi:ribulose-5-phosphate 4-epimerase/fuculose-1-phosphate aldolase
MVREGRKRVCRSPGRSIIKRGLINMVADDVSIRKEIVDITRRAEALGLVQYSQGNFSARIPGTDYILITPSAVPYANMNSDDIVTMDLEGQKVHGIHEPTSEKEIHTLAYRTRSHVGGCVHVESPYVNTLYTLNLTVPNILGNFVYLFAGKGLAVAPSIRSGNANFAQITLEAMGDHFGIIWKNHGMFCVGRDIRSAFDRCIAAEQAARVYYQALALKIGEPDLIPEEIQAEMVAFAAERGWERAV